MKNPFEAYTGQNEKQGRRGLDWEESALDSHKKVEEGLFDPQRRVPNLKWLGIFLAVSFVVLGFRLFRLQVVEGRTRVGVLRGRHRQGALVAERHLAWVGRSST